MYLHARDGISCSLMVGERFRQAIKFGVFQPVANKIRKVEGIASKYFICATIKYINGNEFGETLLKASEGETYTRCQMAALDKNAAKPDIRGPL